jgi:hypothetical protein
VGIVYSCLSLSWHVHEVWTLTPAVILIEDVQVHVTVQQLIDRPEQL